MIGIRFREAVYTVRSIKVNFEAPLKVDFDWLEVFLVWMRATSSENRFENTVNKYVVSMSFSQGK